MGVDFDAEAVVYEGVGYDVEEDGAHGCGSGIRASESVGKML